MMTRRKGGGGGTCQHVVFFMKAVNKSGMFKVFDC